MRSVTASDRFEDLVVAIDKTGYYPEVVVAGVRAAVAGEPVASFLVHHEPTIDRDEVRRHITVVVLTATRMILCHTDEHAPDELLPEPYTSSSSEAIRLSSVRSVVVNRMVANPASFAGRGEPTPSEAVLTVGWGGISRIDLEPAACSDPECDADHGYTGVLATDDFSLRVSSAADGQTAVDELLAFAEPLRPHAGLSGQLGMQRGSTGQDLLTPSYADRSLGQVLPAVATALGVEAGFEETSLELPPAPAYVVMLVDGLGYDLLAEHREQAPYLHSLLAHHPVPAVCGVPSTTATSLTSLGTALTPGQHGLVGFTSRVPETGALLNSLFWDQPVDPLQWQPHATAFMRLESAGAHTSVVSKGEFAGSGLTRCGQRGAAYVPAEDVAARVAGAVAGAARHPSLTYVYDGDLDWHGHRAGVDSQRWRAQLRDIDEDVQELRDSLPPEVRLVVVADHGMVDSTPATHLDVDSVPGLRDGVVLLGGEARFRHVYCRGGAVDDVAAAWRSWLGERATVLTRDEAIGRGWFGAVDPGVRLRIGDVVAAAHDDWALMSSVDFAYETTLIGLHGSLTPRELRIPLLVC